MSNISHVPSEDILAKLPFEKGISVYSQNLWITLWVIRGGVGLKRRGLSVFVTLLIFCLTAKLFANNDLL
ncbi:MAG TPA: hypothetical protein VGD24_03945 [Gallionella sp.]